VSFRSKSTDRARGRPRLGVLRIGWRQANTRAGTPSYIEAQPGSYIVYQQARHVNRPEVQLAWSRKKRFNILSSLSSRRGLLWRGLFIGAPCKAHNPVRFGGAPRLEHFAAVQDLQT
jgi:hypothetical protein